MAQAHNGMLRALNSIYLQAPHLTTPTDIADLLTYCGMWTGWVAHHHHAEETLFFPPVEQLAGVSQGLMSKNVEQHHVFEGGLKTFAAYVEDCKGGRKRFDATELKAIIDGFGPDLARHLSDEIPTLLQLEKCTDEVGLARAYDAFELDLRNGDKFVQYPIVFGSADRTYEGGNDFPVVPFFVPYLVHYYFERQYQGSWRFNPCDTWGKPRPLQFLD